ncbi:hypothetical protein SLEP1_g36282 [Rubroshorea leprosula]|uniref:Uncharacterized protein n=1 Tax=Rubroshorea leprosula TaxID=152421 RepID=A0AAV5KRB0_9ROSI|nr:hypothetical protein SLEP1_g36282 [Rubroshorea leprosula]
MKFKLEGLTKRFIKRLKRILGRQYFMPQSLICRQQPLWLSTALTLASSESFCT